MSSPLAIAAVTTLLRELIRAGLEQIDLSPIGTFTVTALPPDRVQTGETEENRLNIFLYQITSNAGWSNTGLPTRSSPPGTVRLANPPLALDLHYLLTGYGTQDANAESLLGCAMEILHESPLLTRGMIQRVLDPGGTLTVAHIPADDQGRSARDLARQFEQVRITPQFLGSDELSRMWTAMQARYRPSMAYKVTTVLIQSERPVLAPLPVLTRGPSDNGVNSHPDLDPALPTLASSEVVAQESGQLKSDAELGDTLVLKGFKLGGDTVVAEFRHPLLKDAIELRPDALASDRRVAFTLPADGTAEWPAGIYRVSLRVERNGVPTVRTNALPVLLAPHIESLELDGPAGHETLVVSFLPDVWPTQRVDLFVGGEPLETQPIESKATWFRVSVAGVRRFGTPVPVRMRVDGVESQSSVRDSPDQPPRFDPRQSIALPP